MNSIIPDTLSIIIIVSLIINIFLIGYLVHEKLNEIKKTKMTLQTNKMENGENNLFEKNALLDEFIDKRMIKVFDRLIQRKYLLFYKTFNNLSDENILKAKEDFINLMEVEFNTQEKLTLQKRFDNFNSFKYYMVDFFNDRMTKFQFVMSFNTDSGDIFKDINIYKSVMNSESSDIIKIMEQFK